VSLVVIHRSYSAAFRGAVDTRRSGFLLGFGHSFAELVRSIDQDQGDLPQGRSLRNVRERTLPVDFPPLRGPSFTSGVAKGPAHLSLAFDNG